jgi:hypothetical protein
MTPQPPDDCSCGINAILESRSHKIQVNPGQQPVAPLNRARFQQVSQVLSVCLSLSHHHISCAARAIRTEPLRAQLGNSV